MAVTVHTSLDELPFRLQQFGEQIPYATANALNTTAFGLMGEMRDQIGEQLNTNNQYTARSVRVEKANKKSLLAKVGTLAWYMGDLIQGGDHTPASIAGRTTGKAGEVGYTHKGKKYLLVVDRANRTKSGRLRRLTRKNKPFVVEDGDDLWLVVQKGKRRNPIIIIGQLVERTAYHKNTFDWESPSDKYIARVFSRNWLNAMERAAATAR